MKISYKAVNTCGKASDCAPVFTHVEYPAYLDLALEGTFDITKIEVLSPVPMRYNLYGSLDGQSFNYIGNENGIEKSSAAAFVRLFVLYSDGIDNVVVNELSIEGNPSKEKAKEPVPVGAADFENTEYAEEITDEDRAAELIALVGRTIGKQYIKYFNFEFLPPSDRDFFTLSDYEDTILISAPNPVSAAYGFHTYLKEFCGCQISQMGYQVKLPSSLPKINGEITRKCKAKYRYAYNYCTHSYTMPFWGEKEWEAEIDWLALNGVNLVLDITGQEEVWRRFLGELGYTHEEIRNYIAGPSYYAWAYMNNLSGTGGPVHDFWFRDRVELARKNQQKMRRFGMQTVLQGYSGMVPVDILDKDPSARVIPQGMWGGLQRPSILYTDDDTFFRYASLFYKCQKKVFGEAHFYATDAFHEGGNKEDLSLFTVGNCVMKSMTDFDPEAVWVIQSWQENPTNELLRALENYRGHALVLDLWGERDPRWSKKEMGGGEFGGTDFVFCMLNDFGGRMGLHGHLDLLINEVPKIFSQCKHALGIGIAPESTHSNPIVYDLFFDLVWQEEKESLSDWLFDYGKRRYGSLTDSLKEALTILSETAYKDANNKIGEGAPESINNARPAKVINAASTWGNSKISYDPALLEKAARLYAENYKEFADSELFRYDLADILKQVLSNRALVLHKGMVEAMENKDENAFDDFSARFLENLDRVDRVTSTQKEFLVGSWIEPSKRLASDDFTRDLYELNARMLITTWSSKSGCNGGLHDYSNRQWSGLTRDYYKTRWIKWIENAKAAFPDMKEDNEDWFPIEWAWVLDKKIYPESPSRESLEELAKEILY